MRLILLISAAAIGLAACSQKPAAETAPSSAAPAAAESGAAAPATATEEPAVDLKGAPTGAYVTEAGHRYITFSYSHQGLSKPWLRWRDWKGDLTWNAEDPSKSSISVVINTPSIDTGVDDFDDHMKSPDLFDVAKFPAATFKSTSIERTGPNTGKITGDLTIKDVTKPIMLDARINAARFAPDRKNPGVGKYKLGFSATAKMKRSEWNMGYAVPFVGDDVDIVVEAEFESPQPLAAPAQ
jgi:polyisoprenoid-binding protein YceI